MKNENESYYKVSQRIRRLHNITEKQVNKRTKLHNQNKVIKLSPNGKNIVINFGFSDEFNSEGKKRALIYRTKIACVKRNQSFSKSVRPTADCHSFQV